MEKIEIVRFEVEDYMKVMGYEKEELNVDEDYVCEVYVGRDEENWESSYVGWKLESGKYYVVGCGIDKYVDSYEEMIELIKEGF